MGGRQERQIFCCIAASDRESMMNGLSGLHDVGGVGMAEIDVVGIELEVADIGAAKKTANGRGTSGGSTEFSPKSWPIANHGPLPWPP